MRAHMLAAFLSILFALALGMLVTRRARHLLSPEMKLDLMERLSQLRIFALAPAVAFIFVVYFKPALSWTVWSFAACITCFYTAKWITVKRALVPEAYLRAIAVEALIGAGGLLAFLAFGLWPYYAA